MNEVRLFGNLGADPEVKHTPSGKAVCEFRLATNEKWTDKNGEKKEHTEWHRIVVWGKMAEPCGKYLAKGKRALVSGKITTRQWEDKDGIKRYTTEILAAHVQFIDYDKSGGRRDEPAENDFGFGGPGAEDDIPF